MSDIETRFHQTWLGMVQPIEGLVVSVPVLVDAQTMLRQPPALGEQVRELAPHTGDPTKPTEAERGPRQIADLENWFQGLLDVGPDLLRRGSDLEDDLSLYVPEGGQTLRPTHALARLDGVDDDSGEEAQKIKSGLSAAARAGSKCLALIWDLPPGLPLDKSETVTGPWHYPPSAKFDRLLRHCRVPIGILTNREVWRLVYAPHGESTGAITFNITDMASVGGRPILDAFVMLHSAQRLYGVAPEHRLDQLLLQSRARQADVTSELSRQVFAALEILLAGFEGAAERDGDAWLRELLEQDHDSFYGGLLTVLLRLVFVLYAEDRGLLPVDHPHYAQHLSLLSLYEELSRDHGTHPDTMSRRFGAWSRLVTLFRAIYLGANHGDFQMPPRRGDLFDPNRFPFLEGFGLAGSVPITQASQRAAARLPSVDDATVFAVLDKLLILAGQRLSYRSLDVEQIGSVYEALMGYHVRRIDSPAVRIGQNRVWLSAAEVLAETPARREKWLKEQTGISTAQAKKVAAAVKGKTSESDVLSALTEFKAKHSEPAQLGRLVLQPGSERRRTSSHYTPRSLTEPIVARTLEPLLATMTKAAGTEGPPSELILQLKVCDPAMGSGAFLVAACRYLADQLVAAWTREGQLEKMAAAHGDIVNHARRLVAQRCLYGVDKNAFAVGLAKLSLWLVTLAKDEPFTFVDHALRHGDSLVGLSLEQIRAFHWKPSGQFELFTKEIDAALDEAVALRHEILELSGDESATAAREKERLLFDAEDALDRVRLIGDLCVGAFFAEAKDKAREKERNRRLDLVTAWLRTGEPATDELRELQRRIRERLPVLHWPIEFPEVFYEERPDPLEGGKVNRAAEVDAFVGNPPFGGKNNISEFGGPELIDWLKTVHEGAHGNADYSAHFFRRSDALLGTHGTIGLIATNTIAQGDTRNTGLQWLVGHGHAIYDATRSMIWPGDAAVAVAVVHIAKGEVQAAAGLELRLDDKSVEAISSRLRSKPERPDPVVLRANASAAYVGSNVLGMGFTLTPEERDALLQKDKKNAERIFPYLGGEEVNTSATQSFHRYVINFEQLNLDEAQAWPDLVEIVREKVKPERDKNNREGYRKWWWHFGEKRNELYAAIRPLPRCLVTSGISKHRVFAYAPTSWVFTHNVYVFPLPHYSAFTTMQSRVHICWSDLLSSGLESRGGYRPSDCFETFPFPQPDPRTVIEPLEQAGEALYTARAKFMVETNQGLTQTYNAMKDPTCTDPAVQHLRTLSESLDRAVLTAYGWPNIEVPPFCTPDTPTRRAELERFEDEVIDHLFVLNAERAEQERILGKGKKKKRARKKKSS